MSRPTPAACDGRPRRSFAKPRQAQEAGIVLVHQEILLAEG